MVACIVGFLSTALTDAWKTSFKRVNIHLHPRFRLSFEDWICKIKQFIDTGTANFQRLDDFWFDAIHVWCHNITVECRHKFLSMSKGLMEEAAKKGKAKWCVKQHVIWLTEFGPANKIFQMRASFVAAQKHREVI
jgi:uncharacterized protein YfaQ (DUF2300 family)